MKKLSFSLLVILVLGCSKEEDLICDLSLSLPNVEYFALGTNNHTLCIPPNGAYIYDDDTSNQKSYVWENGDTNTLRFINKSGSYTLSAFDASNNFLYTKTQVFNICETPFIPEHFTPNGDGINDVWTPIYMGVCSYITRVFDRRNKLVFENRSTEGQKAWDGTFKGKMLSEGTYTYNVQSVDFAGVKKNDYGVLTLEAY